MPKLIVINLQELRSAVTERLERDPSVPAAMRGTAARLICRAVLQDNSIMLGVFTPRSTDPAWVTKRLAEGHNVWRAVATEVELQRVIATICDPLRAVLMHAARRDAHEGVRNKAHFLLKKKASRMEPRDFLDAAETVLSWQKSDDLAARYAHVPFVAPAQITMGARAWRRCTTLAEIGAAGRALENCLDATAGIPSPFRCEAARHGRHVYWTLHEGNDMLAVAEVWPDHHWAREIRGYDNADVCEILTGEIAALTAALGLRPYDPLPEDAIPHLHDEPDPYHPEVMALRGPHPADVPANEETRSRFADRELSLRERKDSGERFVIGMPAEG